MTTEEIQAFEYRGLKVRVFISRLGSGYVGQNVSLLSKTGNRIIQKRTLLIFATQADLEKYIDRFVQITKEEIDKYPAIFKPSGAD